MSEDYSYKFPNLTTQQAKNAALFEIKKLLNDQGIVLKHLKLEEPYTPDNNEIQKFATYNSGECQFDPIFEKQECEKLQKQLNSQQSMVFEKIKTALETNKVLIQILNILYHHNNYSYHNINMFYILAMVRLCRRHW